MNLKPWAWALTHSKSSEPQTFGLGFNSSKVVLVLSLGLGPLIQSMFDGLGILLTKLGSGIGLELLPYVIWIPKPFFKDGPKSGT